MVKVKSFILLFCIVLSSCFVFAEVSSEIIFPRVEVVNKTQSNSIEVTEVLSAIPKKKVGEIILRSSEFSIFKQKQAGDYILLIIKKFKDNTFITNWVKLQLIFHSENSAEFAFYDIDNNLILSDVNVATDRTKILDVTLNGEEDIVVGYLGYDDNDLPAFKVKSYLPEGKIYDRSNYCELDSSRTKYNCYKEGGNGQVLETYELSASTLSLLNQSIEDAMNEKITQEALDRLNENVSKSSNDKVSMQGEQGVKWDWTKIGLIIGIMILLIVAFYTTKKASKKKKNDYGGDSMNY